MAFLILPVAFVWGCVYWGFGERGVALTPWAYVTGSVLSIVIFARTLNFAFFRTAQFLLILVAPALGTSGRWSRTPAPTRGQSASCRSSCRVSRNCEAP